MIILTALSLFYFLGNIYETTLRSSAISNHENIAEHVQSVTNIYSMFPMLKESIVGNQLTNVLRQAAGRFLALALTSFITVTISPDRKWHASVLFRETKDMHIRNI